MFGPSNKLTCVGLFLCALHLISAEALAVSKCSEIFASDTSNSSPTIRAAVQLVSDQGHRFEAVFRDQFKWDQIKNSLKTSSGIDPVLAKALRLLENEDVDIYIFSAEPKLVVQSGILNVHQVDDPEKLISNRRNFIEAGALQMLPQEYAKMNDRIKPKYGLIVPKGMKPVFPGYGVPYRVNLVSVRDRMTFSAAGDSRNRFNKGIKLPWSFSGDFKIDDQPNKILELSHWSYAFIPWKYRSLLSASVAEGMKGAEFGISDRWRDPLFPEYSRSRNYIEIQIFGEITSDMVEAVVP